MKPDTRMPPPSMVVCIPTLNAGPRWNTICQALSIQTALPAEKYIGDSRSRDQTVAIAREHGFVILDIAPETFDHGITRNQLMVQTTADILVFMTQDALPASSHTLAALLESFADPQVGAVTGRQLPRPEAGSVEAYARLFNYPEVPRRTTASDIERMGIKAAFVSNSFCAWRRTALVEIGGFPSTIMGEDTLAAARLLKAGWTVSYCPQAAVYHSHDYTIWQEAQRYFDIGVFHQDFADELAQYGPPEKEGRRFVLHQMQYLWQTAAWLIPAALLRIGAKYAGYRIGRRYQQISFRWRTLFSMHPHWWSNTRNAAIGNTPSEDTSPLGYP